MRGGRTTRESPTFHFKLPHSNDCHPNLSLYEVSSVFLYFQRSNLAACNSHRRPLLPTLPCPQADCTLKRFRHFVHQLSVTISREEEISLVLLDSCLGIMVHTCLRYDIDLTSLVLTWSEGYLPLISRSHLFLL